MADRPLTLAADEGGEKNRTGYWNHGVWGDGDVGPDAPLS